MNPNRWILVVLLAALGLTLLGLRDVSFVHRSLIDETVPLHVSSYLMARGFPLPWWIVEIPPELGVVPLLQRLILPSFIMNYVFYLGLIVLVGGIVYGLRAFLRILRGDQPTDTSSEPGAAELTGSGKGRR